MKYCMASASLGISILLISACTNPRVDLARMESIDVQSNEIKYRQESERFLRLAKVGDLNGLIRLTSSRTLLSHGREKVVQNYERELIPTVRKSRIEWNSGSTIIYDSNYNVGLEFSGMLYEIKAVHFYISVFKENGKIVIVNIRKTKLPVEH